MIPYYAVALAVVPPLRQARTGLNGWECSLIFSLFGKLKCPRIPLCSARVAICSAFHAEPEAAMSCVLAEEMLREFMASSPGWLAAVLYQPSSQTSRKEQ